MISRRCTQRQYLLRPDAETNNAFLYCLIVAAQRFNVQLLLPSAMSNHHHTVIFDREGCYPAFLEHFHKLFARSQNALRGRWENFWSSEQASVVILVDREDVLNKLVYAATNPVKDHLVDRVHHWPGVNGLRSLLSGKPLRATRPKHFFRTEGKMPAEVEMTLEIPPEVGPADALLEELERRVAEVEEKMADERRRTGRRVVGRGAVRKQSWHARPATFEPRRGLNPRIAARSLWSRLEAILQERKFQREYAKARAAWMDGAEAVFPRGTYWLHRFAHVRLAPA